MKKILSLIALVVVGCSSAVDDKGVGKALLTGWIADGGIAEVRINGAPPAISDGWSNTEDLNDVVVSVQADGTFEIPLALNGPKFLRLSVAGRTIEIFLEPGQISSVSIGSTSGSKNGPTIDFSGDNATQNRFSMELAGLLAESERNLGQNVVEIFSLDLSGFEARLDTLKQNLLEQHKRFLDENTDTRNLYVQRSLADVDYWFKTLKLLYPTVHLEVTGKSADVDSSYLEDVGQGSFDQPDWLSSSTFVRFLDQYVDLVSAGDLRFGSRDLPREILVSRYQAIESLAASPEIKTYLFEQMFRTFRTSYGPRDWGPVLSLLDQSGVDNRVVAAVKPLYEQDLAQREEPDEIRVFREVDGVSLEAHIFYPRGSRQGENRPAYLFFHGGGWAIGTPEWGYANCKRMASKGMVAISFEYRLADVHGSNILASVDDVQFAVRWAREHAGRRDGELGIDPERIVAAGFSAGGHLAAAAAILDVHGDSTPSSKPNALIIHSSSYNLTKGSFFYAMTDGDPEAVSLYHQVRTDLVPAILFHGSDDHLATIDEFREFVGRMESLDNDFEYHIFEDVGHFFRNEDARSRVIRLTDEFLAKRGFLDRAGLSATKAQPGGS